MVGKRLFRLAMMAALEFSSAGVHAAPSLQVVFPRPETPYDARTGYPVAVLRLALEHLNVAFSMKQSAIVLSQARTLRLLEDNQVVTVGWSVATVERDKRLLTVRVPIDRGLIGWRILLIRRDEEKQFRDLLTVSQLAHVPMAQDQDWPDLAILRDNGFDMTAAFDYASLFSMLKLGHVDAVPRSVAEIGQELQSPDGADLVAETHLLLHYPSALVFFVSKSNPSLAAELQKGLERAIADGSLRRLFELTYRQSLNALHLHDRHVIELTNPLLPASMVPACRDFGFQPETTQ
ncbi:transporter substrate-binding domain-containing protein [Rhodanobacter sp. 7MK24]|uniref:substrate-binding periplasmic protein n=1 Tax=Rhodanobacter sp. 7MK24 TaxID=2775922 RepID=UPI00177BC431|nr:transporter substrate-binding domain-containing protein [Rhodanobacter sp. 7MK24]MBD8878941.1 transporter substrate-binding domain-containing protein [Rhodanobacter sp. 7MK24]